MLNSLKKIFILIFILYTFFEIAIPEELFIKNIALTVKRPIKIDMLAYFEIRENIINCALISPMGLSFINFSFTKPKIYNLGKKTKKNKNIIADIIANSKILYSSQLLKNKKVNLLIIKSIIYLYIFALNPEGFKITKHFKKIPKGFRYRIDKIEKNKNQNEIIYYTIHYKYLKLSATIIKK